MMKFTFNIVYSTVLFTLCILILVQCNLPQNTKDELETVEGEVIHSKFIPQNYSLLFNDEFEKLNLDVDGNGSGNWSPWFVGFDVRYLDGNEDKCFKIDKSYKNLDVDLHEISKDSTLLLYGKETPQEKLKITNQLPYIGGMISGQQSHWQKYGYWEIRAKLDATKGHHWGIWLLPTDNTWPPEVDIVEHVGHEPNKIYMTTHWGSSEDHKSDFQELEGYDPSQWHTYGFLWTADSMKWFFDGELLKKRETIIHKDMYLLVTPEIGGKWTGLPDSTTIWPMKAEIDYVRTYSEK